MRYNFRHFSDTLWKEKKIKFNPNAFSTSAVRSNSQAETQFENNGMQYNFGFLLNLTMNIIMRRYLRILNKNINSS